MSTWRSFGVPRSEQEPVRLSEPLDRAARRLGGPSSGVASALFTRWSEVVGPDIASHARPLSLREGVLTLGVEQPAWAAQLRYMTDDILTRIGAATARSEVTEIHIRVLGETPGERPFRRARKRGF